MDTTKVDISQVDVAKARPLGWVPATLIKGGDGTEDGEMLLEGVASTASVDLDNHKLLPKGFIIDYFKSNGRINWNHNPLDIIGEPVKATIDSAKNTFSVRAKLYKSSNKAKQVYDLAKVLEAEGKPLGWSIEGIPMKVKAVAKGSTEPLEITKTIITACALTPSPKNRDSVISIVKGLAAQDDNWLQFVVDNGGYDTLFKAAPEVSDDVDPADDDPANKEVEEDTDPVEETQKGMTAGSPSGQAQQKESLNGPVKDTTTADTHLSKGAVMQWIYDNYAGVDGSMAESLYSMLKTIQKGLNMDKPEVTPEALDQLKGSLDGIIAKGAPAQPATPSEGKNDDLELTQDHIDASVAILKAAGHTVVLKGAQPAADAPAEAAPAAEDTTELGTLIKGHFDNLNAKLDAKSAETAGDVATIAQVVKGVQEVTEALKGDIAKVLSYNPGLRSQMSEHAIVEKGAQPGPTEELETLQKGANGAQMPQLPEEVTPMSISLHKGAVEQKALALLEEKGDAGLPNGFRQSIAVFNTSGEANAALTKGFADNKILLTK